MAGLVLEIDGRAVQIERAGGDRHGWESFYVMGEDRPGRRCRVAQHSAPVGALDRPGTWRTGGRVYRVRRPEAD